MQNKKLIALIILSIFAVISLIYGIPTRRRLATGPYTATQKLEGIKLEERIMPAKRLTKRTVFATWGRSPFLPKELYARRFPDLALNGIVWDEENPSAIINGEIIIIGDKIGENSIIDIKPDRVILNDGTDDFELKLERE